jgi:hypothetical protein
MAEPFGGSLRSSSQPLGMWQRSQVSAAFGVPTAQIESWAATVIALQKKKSRADCPIIDPFQRKPGSIAGLYPEWQVMQAAAG